MNQSLARRLPNHWRHQRHLMEPQSCRVGNWASRAVVRRLVNLRYSVHQASTLHLDCLDSQRREWATELDGRPCRTSCRYPSAAFGRSYPDRSLPEPGRQRDWTGQHQVRPIRGLKTERSQYRSGLRPKSRMSFRTIHHLMIHHSMIHPRYFGHGPKR